MDQNQSVFNLQYAGQHKLHGSLNLTRSDRGLLVVAREAGRLLGQLLEDVIDETVHNLHSFAGDPNMRVYLFQHLKQVNLVSLAAFLHLLLLNFRIAADGFLCWDLLISLGGFFSAVAAGSIPPGKD